MEQKLQCFGHLIGRTESLEKNLMLGKTEGRRGWQGMRWLSVMTDSKDTSLNKLQETVTHRKTWSAVVHGVAELDKT